MINYVQQEWKNKDEDGAVPLTSSHLNRMEAGIASAADGIDALNSHWWRKSRIAGGSLNREGSYGYKYFYIWDTDVATSYIYYSSSVEIVTDSVSGACYAKLVDATEEKISYSTIGKSGILMTSELYFIIGSTTTENGAKLYQLPSSNGWYLERASRTSENPSYGCYISCYEVSVAPTYEKIGYESSQNPNEYSNGAVHTDGFFYEYLGVPFDNSREAGGTYCGTFVGDGIVPRKIETPRTPKAVWLWQDRAFLSSSYSVMRTSSMPKDDYLYITEEGFVVASTDYYLNRTEKTYYYIVWY